MHPVIPVNRCNNGHEKEDPLHLHAQVGPFADGGTGDMNAKYGDHCVVCSGSTDVTRIHPIAVEGMKEIGISISVHRSKSDDDLFGRGIETGVKVLRLRTERVPVTPEGKGGHPPGFWGPPVFTRESPEKDEPGEKVTGYLPPPSITRKYYDTILAMKSAWNARSADDFYP